MTDSEPIEQKNDVESTWDCTVPDIPKYREKKTQNRISRIHKNVGMAVFKEKK